MVVGSLAPALMLDMIRGYSFVPLFLLAVSCYCLAVAAFQYSYYTPRAKRNKHQHSKLEASKRAHSSKQPKSTKSKQGEKRNALDSCLETSFKADRDVLIMVDSNNVRGREDFKITNRDLLVKLKTWRKHCYPEIHIVYAIDHGSIPEIHHYEGLGIIEFAGPNRTADDVIAQSARWFSNVSTSETQKYEGKNMNCDVFIVTSDGGLKKRCISANKQGNFKRKRLVKENIKVFSSQQILSSLEQVETIDEANEDELQHSIESRILEVENDLRLYERQRPPWPSRQAKLDAMARGPWISTILSRCTDVDEAISTELLMTSFEEKTWHRILVAENLRRMLKQLSGSPSRPTKYLVDGLLGRYRILHENSLIKLDTTPSSMVYDRRIRFEPALQQEVIGYMERGVASIYSNNTSEFAATKSSVETAADLLKELILESPLKTQDQILLRYLSEAPRQLQFPTKHDLRALLQFIAVREKRDFNSRRMWYVVDHPSLDCWHVQPGESRRRKRRRVERQARSDTRTPDQALLQDGAKAEQKWFALLRWPKELT